MEEACVYLTVDGCGLVVVEEEEDRRKRGMAMNIVGSRLVLH